MGQSGHKGGATENMHRILKTNFKGPFPAGTERVVVATGCFWGTEKSFWRLPGVYTTAVGYSGGTTKNPTYEQVCSGRTGHTEAVLVVWNPERLSFTDIVRMYLQCHNPTQVNGQGNDRGTQYRTAVYYTTDDQRRITEAAIAAYEKQLGKKIATELKPLDEFYCAEDYHQQYLAAQGSRQYCSAMPLGVQLQPADKWLPADLQKKYNPKLGEDFWQAHAPSPHCVLRDPHEPIQWPPKGPL